MRGSAARQLRARQPEVTSSPDSRIPTPESRRPDTLVCVVFYNEKDRLGATLARFPSNRDYDVVVVDDGSTDRSAEDAERSGFRVIRHPTNRGIGAAIRSGMDAALAGGYDYFVVTAGSGKLLPEELPVVLDPVREGTCDYCQGSRFLRGEHTTNFPAHRKWMIKGFNLFVLLLMGRWFSDVTCGYRAYTTKLLRDPRVNIHQPWLDRYEMEYYVHYKALTGGYRILEVPVTVAYPADEKQYSKIRPIVGWFSMLRPWLLLRLGLRN
ncbi:MAG: glycosyltransferase family 2 protein [Acidobacteria bacterium]|nr:glycosyltransferase family 2 protein [Acidobacteriota bacterium]